MQGLPSLQVRILPRQVGGLAHQLSVQVRTPRPGQASRLCVAERIISSTNLWRVVAVAVPGIPLSIPCSLPLPA